MEDTQIVALFFNRDQRAIREAEAKYGAYCFRIAQGILQNKEDAEEAVNDTWLGAWASIPPHKPAMLSTFLGKITRRAALKRWEYRRCSKRGGGEVDLALDELAKILPDRNTPETALANADLTRILNEFLMGLPHVERNIFVRRYWYLDPIRDIAKGYSFTQSKVKSMLARTRKKLQTTLEKEGISL